MINKLERLTISQFTDLMCGNTDVLLVDGERAQNDELAKAMRNIVYEYRTIADKAGAKSYLARMEEYLKARISTLLFTICDNLVALGEYCRARETLIECGLNAKHMNDQRVAAEVASRLAQARRTVDRLEGEMPSGDIDPSEVRSSFDELTATLMAYFGFQIDTATIKATQYAYLVARHDREIKAQLSALKR